MSHELQPEEWKSPTGYAPAQLDFLEIFHIDKSAWTRAIAFYDCIPKFVFSSDAKARLTAYTARKNSFEFEGTPFKVTRTPGQIVREGKKGQKDETFGRWPGEREELISRALRYLAVQQGVPLSVWEHPKHQPQIRVAFTLNQIVVLLKEWGHTFSSREIDEGLQILMRSTITVTVGEEKKGKALYAGALIAGYIGLDDNDGTQKRAVILNPLEAEAIFKGAFRVLHFQRVMTLPSPLSRRLYELLMLRFINAEKPPDGTKDYDEKIPSPYKLHLSQLIAEGVVDAAKEISKTAARIRKCLDELTDSGVLWRKQPYTEHRATKTTGGRSRIVDVTWNVWLSKEAVSDVIAANMEYAAGKDKILLSLPAGKRAEIRRRAKRELP